MRKFTNIQLKRAEYSIWLEKYADYIPLRGEPCIAYNVGEHKDTQIKIGDGTSTFAELDFLGKNNAIDIRYDNEKSGLNATNVQDALDELQTVLVRDFEPTEEDASDLGDFWVDQTSQKAFQLIAIEDNKYTWKQLAYTDTLVDEAKAAKKLSEARTISISNDATGSVSFDGSKDVDIAITLKDTIEEGKYTKITVDSKGRAIKGETLIQSDIPQLDSDKVTDIDEEDSTGTPITLRASLQKIKDSIAQEVSDREQGDKNLEETIKKEIASVLSEEVTFKGVVDDQTKLPTEGNTNGDLYWIRAFVAEVPEGMHEGRSGAAIYTKDSGFQYTEDAVYQPDGKTITLGENLQLEVVISTDQDNAIEARENGLFVVTSHLVPKTTKVNGYTLDKDVSLTTDDVPEGENNLYYTEERVQDVVKGMSSRDLTDTENILYMTDELILSCGGASEE